MSKDIPIIFSAPMVRALLEGRKTQTRRILKPQPEPFLVDNKPCEVGLLQVGSDPRPRVTLGHVVTRQEVRFAVGDRLWVRENYAYVGARDPGFLTYGATYPGDLAKYGCENVPATLKEAGYKWKPSIHMPREVSRLTLVVAGVKVERLQDISEDDAVAEGIARLFTEEECRTVAGIVGTKPEDHGWQNYLWHGLIGREITAAQSEAWQHQYSGYRYARGSFSSLWARINGVESWDQNPFVVATTFRVIKANIDAPEARAA